MPVNDRLKKLFARVEELKPEMRATWAYLVDRDCGSANKAGVDSLGISVRHFLEKCGFSVRFHEYEKAGNLLVAERGDMRKPFICLVGHLDTVFPDGASVERPLVFRNGIVTGAGCLDMKGGVTILLYAMKILAEQGWERYPVKILLAGDEEVAHRSSTAPRDLIEESRGALMGFNFETRFLDDSVILGRMGYLLYRVEVEGVSAHAGNNPEDGRSAIMELARKMIEIDALADHAEGTLINVGVMGGGTVANAIPDKAWCVVDIRFTKADEAERVKKAMAAIAGQAFIEGTRTVLEKKVDIPAMERTEASERLFEKVEAIAEAAGLPAMKPKCVGGGSDSVFLSRAGVPTICAMGVKGEFNHTEREYAIEQSLYEREKLILAVLEQI